MSISFLISAAFLPLISFFLPKGRQFAITISIQLIVAFYTVAIAVSALGFGSTASYLGCLAGGTPISIDPLSFLFVAAINLVCVLSSVYSKGYLAPYLATKNRSELALHGAALVWLQVSMLLVVTLREGFAFLSAWEAMTLASFILVMFEAEKRETFKVGISYLIQMHVGFFLILAGFVVAYAKTGIFGFDALASYFTLNNGIPVFLLFFLGFGLKAGFVPLHTWLPNAHPAAPSHVSGAMSGIMIKMGIYGIIRVLFAMRNQYFEVGMILLLVSLLTGVWGVISAIVQKDLKKVLAYSSIENIGIIGIGLGLGFIGIHIQYPQLSLLAFTGAVLHIVNHSLFKPMLFMGAGSVYTATHTRNMNDLGGLIKKMPHTSFLFIFGAMAICALPPFNGFISELLIYVGMFGSLAGQSLRETIMLITSSMVLALIGGLAVFAFSKAVGIAFLGVPRKPIDHVKEVTGWMLVPQYILLAAIVMIGLFPTVAIKLILPVVAQFPQVTASPELLQPVLHTTSSITWISLAFVGFIAIIFFARKRVQQDVVITEGPTWGCGYSAVNSTQQYTSTSYADSLISISKPLVKVTKDFDPLEKTDFFPHATSFKTGSNDLFEDMVTVRPANKLQKLIRRAAILQTGHVQHYVLYALLFIVAIFVLTYFKMI
ncbi:proton-conducting transporter membrane subunit [uncultured Acetobacteroides sp.]|uniref:proton-conducting transporter transmembrane domain-containing protein n=1 Tax=uncultured Acetobacteroides sp. TaxID=1760811 RepID=UPI0029F45EC6|nr:proton-conducting transporter membrane subunit [uncultured Acetobacteroides sp.]